MAPRQRVDVTAVQLDISHLRVDYTTTFKINGAYNHRWVQGVTAHALPIELGLLSFLLASATTWYHETTTPVQVALPVPLGFRSNSVFRKIFDYQRPGAARIRIDHEYAIRGLESIEDASQVPRLPMDTAFQAQEAPESRLLLANDVLLENLVRASLASWSRDTPATRLDLGLPDEVFWFTPKYENAWPYAKRFILGYGRVLSALYGGTVSLGYGAASSRLECNETKWTRHSLDLLTRANSSSPSRSSMVAVLNARTTQDWDGHIAPILGDLLHCPDSDQYDVAVRSPYLLEYASWLLTKSTHDRGGFSSGQFLSWRGPASFIAGASEFFGPDLTSFY